LARLADVVLDKVHARLGKARVDLQRAVERRIGSRLVAVLTQRRTEDVEPAMITVVLSWRRRDRCTANPSLNNPSRATGALQL
jgi:hypothetical protein